MDDQDITKVGEYFILQILNMMLTVMTLVMKTMNNNTHNVNSMLYCCIVDHIMYCCYSEVLTILCCTICDQFALCMN